MDRKQCVLLLNITFLLLHTVIGQTDIIKKKQLSKESNDTQEKVAADTAGHGKSEENGEQHTVLDLYRVIPAAVTIMIFVVGSISIFIYERRKEKKKLKLNSDDIDDAEDSQLNAAWLSSLAKQNRRKMGVIGKVRRFSLSMKAFENERDLEKERKYKIYDDMLEKYRETLRVLRKGTKPQVSNGDRPAARLKRLAELHKQQTTDTQMSEESGATDEKKGSIDQYEITLQMLKQESEGGYPSTEERIEERIEEESEEKADVEEPMVRDKDENEEPEIDPVYLTRRRRSSRFRKQAVIDEDGSLDRPSLSRPAALFQSYMASHENIEIPEEDKTSVAVSGNEDDDHEIIEVLQKSSEAEISALHRIQQRMRPKSFVESLAAIHRETASLSSPLAYSLTSLPKADSKYKPLHLVEQKTKPEAKSDEKISNYLDEATSSNNPAWRGKQKLRNRPKSLYETGVARRKISQTKKPRARPASLYIQHRIQEAIPETQRESPIQIESEIPWNDSRSSSQKYLEIGSLHDIPFSSMTADEEENVIAEIEKQLIAQVCDENDLSNDEIKALEILLDDVATYPKQDSPSSKPKVEKQYSFTDSVSLFGDMEHEGLEEADESEETVLMSLKDLNLPSSSKRLSYSAYDNV